MLVSLSSIEIVFVRVDHMFVLVRSEDFSESVLLFVVFFHLRKVARNLPRCAAAVDTTAAPRKFLCLRVYSLHCRPHSKEKQLFFYRGRDVILSGVAAKVCSAAAFYCHGHKPSP